MSRSTTKAMRERLQRFDAAKLVDVRVCVGATGRSTKRVTVLYTNGKREPMALSRLVTFEQRARRLANSGLKWPVRTQQSLAALVAEARLRIQTDPNVSLRAERGRKRALLSAAWKQIDRAKRVLAEAMSAVLAADLPRDEVIAAVDVGRTYDEAIVAEVHNL